MMEKSEAGAGPSVRSAERKKSCHRGFLFTLEAVSSLLLLMIAASFLPSFRLQESHADEFFLCSDAAGVLVKSSAFSGGHLQEKVAELENISSLCIEAGAEGAAASSSCPDTRGDRYSFTFPVLLAGHIANASVSCWQREAP